MHTVHRLLMTLSKINTDGIQLPVAVYTNLSLLCTVSEIYHF